MSTHRERYGQWVYTLCNCLDLIRDIRDPEKPETLEQLHVVYESGVKVKPLNSKTFVISIEFSPTVQHCSHASLIGLLSFLRLVLYVKIMLWRYEILARWSISIWFWIEKSRFRFYSIFSPCLVLTQYSVWNRRKL